MSKKVFAWLKFSTKVCVNIMYWINNLKFKNMEHQWSLLFSRQITLTTTSVNKQILVTWISPEKSIFH